MTKDVPVKSRNLYGLVRDWRTQLDKKPQGVAGVDNLRKSTGTGRPAGGRDFEKQMEKLTGRMLQRQKPGPGKKPGD